MRCPNTRESKTHDWNVNGALIQTHTDNVATLWYVT